MTPQELYQQGRVRETITALGDELKKNPLDAGRRTFLFQLLLFVGDYDRAEKQLNVLDDVNPESSAGKLVYRSALHAERIRQKMFAEGTTPASSHSRVAGPGIANGSAFTSLTDADPRIGANLEIFMAGSYVWIPTAYVRRLEIEPPVNLRDLMWARARIETTPDFRIQELGEVLLPAISPLSFRHLDETVQLGREAAWESDETYGQLPFGTKLMDIDGVDVPLLDLRLIEWDHAGEAEPAAEESGHASA